MTGDRTIRVEALSRVEGEGGLFVRLRDRQVEEVELRIYEPPRFFEAFLRGRAVEDVPDIVARICGICPVAYQMSAVHALERALGVTPSPAVRRLRRLLYCGEWIESHVLHMFLLHAPDFLSFESGLAMAGVHRDEVARGLRLKKYGNHLLEVLAGRAIHPINVRVGGFHRFPQREAMSVLIPELEWAREAAVAATRWVAGFRFPEFELDYDFVALVHPDEYPLNEGQVASSRGNVWSVDAYETEFEETHVPHSTALHARRKSTAQPYLVGPLARVHLNFDRLCPIAQDIARDVGFPRPCRNPFWSIVARGLEVIHVCDEALGIVQDYVDQRAEFAAESAAHVALPRAAGEGCAATEAPRGLLYHRYQVDADGKIMLAKIVPPTSQNQGQMERDVREWLPRVLAADEAHIARTCEHVIRNFDPCISCSTHFLRLTLEGR
jgi:coenzyme F420-reducing hydrogenase alpha subunit